jgi:AcrR family transcriptional regulator
VGRIAGVTAEETRERLLDAAVRVFELKGYEGATVALIAREAGVTTGAIYAHYASRAELLVEAIRAHSERATAALFPPGSPTDSASVLIALGTRLARRDHEATNLLAEATLAARRDPELAAVLAGALAEREQRTTALLSRGQARGELTGDIAPEAAARFALMLGLGSMLVSSLGLPGPDPDDWNTFIRQLIGAFTQNAPGAPDTPTLPDHEETKP